MYKKVFKQIIDFIIALIAIIVLSPVFILVIICLYLANKGTPFFFQDRPGLNEKVFKIIKFKTMNDKKDATGQLLPDEDRLTKIGMLIRKSSLDELPQLINVLKGDMSLIGPRPLRTYYLPLYNDAQRKRHNVRPGITGWAQVNGRNTISWTRKFELDIYYADNVSLFLDLQIIILTIKKVILREGISQEGQATVERFNGYN